MKSNSSETLLIITFSLSNKDTALPEYDRGLEKYIDRWRRSKEHPGFLTEFFWMEFLSPAARRFGSARAASAGGRKVPGAPEDWTGQEKSIGTAANRVEPVSRQFGLRTAPSREP